MVSETKNGEVNKAYLLQNASHISSILHKRFTYVLTKNKIEYVVDKDEVKTKDPTKADKLYEEELEKLKDELKLHKGDYKKIKIYG